MAERRAFLLLTLLARSRSRWSKKARIRSALRSGKVTSVGDFPIRFSAKASSSLNVSR